MSMPERLNRTNSQTGTFAAYAHEKPTQRIDLSEIASDLLPKDKQPLIDFVFERNARNESEALGILEELKLEDTNSSYPPEE